MKLHLSNIYQNIKEKEVEIDNKHYIKQIELWIKTSKISYDDLQDLADMAYQQEQINDARTNDE